MEWTWMHLILLTLACFRLTRLIVDDTITEWLRAPFHHYLEETDEAGNVEVFVEAKGTGLRAFIGELLSCHWCTGVWASGMLLIGWAFVPYFDWLVVWLAIAGAASILRVALDI
ncbi:sporulation protein YjcA [Thalassobacillus devorans]|uniref:Sporulation protein YjcA n=2 Tax=Thalassobacillus devorans TaxID=279813 RepID=A0ABQ1NEV7_9BACI|nr:hypothetical protein [Thalassobacillus devorans]GGC74909.1 sporulation protein YjcA [Thalassobacillus devorans]